MSESLKKFKHLLNKLNKRYNSLFNNDQLDEINKRVSISNNILSNNNIKPIKTKALKNNLSLIKSSTERTFSIKT